MKIILPGLIDPHVHLRDPGGTHKEDWDSGTAAALAGGFTTVCAMPNTTPPIIDSAALAQTLANAAQKARCDYGVYVGATLGNVQSAKTLSHRVVGKKMYLNGTFGTLKMEQLDAMVEHCANWDPAKPLLAHAEQHTCAAAIFAAHLAGRSIHICHISRAEEVFLIRTAKEKGIQVTCEVCPHHLFNCLDDVPIIGVGRAEVRPMLATSADRAALRENLDVIDTFGTDHAPHLLSEKDSATPPPGYPGLETALAFYLELAHEGVISLDDIIAKCYTNVCRIFNMPEQNDTWVEVDTDETWVARGANMYTRAKWTPWEGRTMHGKVQRVVLRGKTAYENGRVLAEIGSGKPVV
jgi:carbamoyl-phosphate synthase/aspartate carbamoyltransferase/dihydroorotase